MNSSRDSWNPDPVSVGERIRSLILQRYKTINRFARFHHFPINPLYKVIGGRMPTVNMLVRLSRALDCSVDFLLGVCSPEVSSEEALQTALTNVHAYRDSWSRNQRLFLAYAALDCLTDSEENILRAFLQVDRDTGKRSSKTKDNLPANR